MKLELKHLAPYLPYRVKLANNRTLTELCSSYYLIDEKHIHEFTSIDEIICGGKTWIKPILRPLSDLTKEIEHNGEKFVPSEVLLKIYREEWVVDSVQINNEYWFSLDFYCGMDIIPTPLWVYEKLFEWHFAIYISEELYININTLKQ